MHDEDCAYASALADLARTQAELAEARGDVERHRRASEEIATRHDGIRDAIKSACGLDPDRTWGEEYLIAAVAELGRKRSEVAPDYRAQVIEARAADPCANLRLDNGTAWPNPDRVVVAFDRMPRPAAADRDIGAPMTDEERTALHDYWTIRSLVGAYDHLCRHPAGVESAVRTLRSLRRAVRRDDAR